jgi:hypothetical protein
MKPHHWGGFVCGSVSIENRLESIGDEFIGGYSRGLDEVFPQRSRPLPQPCGVGADGVAGRFSGEAGGWLKTKSLWNQSALRGEAGGTSGDGGGITFPCGWKPRSRNPWASALASSSGEFTSNSWPSPSGRRASRAARVVAGAFGRGGDSQVKRGMIDNKEVMERVGTAGRSRGNRRGRRGTSGQGSGSGWAGCVCGSRLRSSRPPLRV